MDNIKKACQMSSYQKETNDLKADILKENLTTNSNKKWEKGVSSRHGSESGMSWRKNSNQLSVASGDSKLPQKGSFFKGPKDKNFKRERFNSDGNPGNKSNQIERIGLYRSSMKEGYNSNPNFFNDRIYDEEVKVDPSKVKYSLKSNIIKEFFC